MTRRRRDFGNMDFEALADRVATTVWGYETRTAITDNTAPIDNPNTFRVHDIQNPQTFPLYEDGEPLVSDMYQSRILQLMSRIEVLETRLAEVSQLLVEHVKRTNPPFDRKKKRCVILDQEREVDEKAGV